MRGERAQITLFVLIGIAVLVIFLFLFPDSERACIDSRV
jgi:ABC-type transporter Mla subunit MlaD